MNLIDDIEKVGEDIVHTVSDIGDGLVNAAASLFEDAQVITGVLTSGAALFIARPAVVIPAFVTGAVAGKALIRQRHLRPDERAFAEEVFGKSLPPNDQIVLTNLVGLKGKKFVCPNMAGQILVNLGEAFDNPTQHVEKAYPAPGKALIHELTHVWQHHHATFSPGLLCEGIFTQIIDATYKPGPGGKPWSAYNLEQQATIVDEWFAPSGRGPDKFKEFSGCRPDHPFYPYIRDNIGGPRWQRLDNNPATKVIVADGQNLYQLHNNGRIFRFTGTPMTGWQELDNNPATKLIIASAGNLYQLHNTGRIFRFTGTPMTGWQELDNNPATASTITDGQNLYQLHNNGRIFRFTGTPMTGWQELDNNSATKQIIVSAGNLYQLHNTGRIYRFTGIPMTGWLELDNNPATASILADGQDLYQLHNNGRIFRFTGTPMTGWQELDNNPATKSIAAAGGRLYQRHESGHIWKFTGIPMTGWKVIDDNPATADITASGDKLYQFHRTGLIWRYPE